MENKQEAGLTETGFGRLGGLIKDTVREEEYGEEVEAAELAQRMAAMTVRRYTNRHGCPGMCTAPEHEQDAKDMAELLVMLGLPGSCDPPTDEEREQLPYNLPHVLHMDTRSPNDHFVPERRNPGHGSRAW